MGKTKMGTKNNPGDFDCYANAKDDEEIFILLGRDNLAPMVVRYWANLYRDRKNVSNEFDVRANKKYHEAIRCAERMETYRSQRLSKQ